jgi:hypothetical protein
MPWKGFSSSAPQMSLEDVKAEVDSLTEVEREKILEDICGEAPALEETEELIQDALAALEEHIEAIPHTSRTPFNRARIECPEYVNDPAFRLMFLRRELFNAEVSESRSCMPMSMLDR